MKKIFTLIFPVFAGFSLLAGTDSSKCNWSKVVSAIHVYNNCDSQKQTVHLIGQVKLNQIFNCKKPVSRVWKVNGSIVSSSENLYYPVSKNGSYTVCVYLYDSCNRCDTVICKTNTVNCLSSCQWYNKVNDFHIRSNCDSSPNLVYISGSYILNKNYTCQKGKIRKWSINKDVIGTGEKLYFNIKQNGTYTVCLWLYDSCNNCDTSICSTITINCLGKTCNWSKTLSSFDAYGVCDSLKNTVNLFGKVKFNTNQNCNKVYRQWSVNNSIVSNTETLAYSVYNNGTYKICVLLYDSCTRCDTTLCETVQINCLSSCDWKHKINDFHVKSNCDSTPQHAYLMGSFIYNKNYTCGKKKWKWVVDNTLVSTSEKLYWEVKKNGTYKVCLWLYDSCNNCDTSICTTVTVNCVPSSCNWSNAIHQFSVWNNCDSQKNHINLIGQVYLNSKYPCKKVYKRWTVNNSIVSYGESLYYPLSKNGTYQVCVLLYDSCTRCDTTICKTVTVNCFKSCQWKSKINDFYVKSNCDSTPQHAFLMGAFIYNKNYTCKQKKWKWTVNNDVVSYSEKLYFNVKKNGNYTVCLYLYDSCNNCDTSYCKTIAVNCLPSCHWADVYDRFFVEPSCDSTRKDVYLQGKFIVKSNYKCSAKVSMKWTVNNSFAGYGPYLNYKIYHNGLYNACVQVYDSCTKCDTMYCRILSVKCPTLSLSGNPAIQTYSIHPNPASQTLEIVNESALGSAVTCEIHDLNGRLLYSGSFQYDGNNKFLIDIHHFSPGLYLVKLMEGDRVQVIKLVKE